MTISEIKQRIGHTPLIECVQLAKELSLGAHLFVKLEKENLAGSIKDRIALQMIMDAIDDGLIKSGDTLIEATSGNTGIAISCIASLLGFKAIIVMPENMTYERRQMIASYGAQIVLTPASLGMDGAIQEAKRLNEEIKGGMILSQFTNPSNIKAHYQNTAPEIDTALDGKIDYVVAGVGTAGTLMGIGKYMREHHANVQMIGVEPLTSPVLNGGVKGPHKIQGIGAGFVPPLFDESLCDKIMDISNEDAYYYAKLVRDVEQIGVGISSGAAIAAGVMLAKDEKNRGKTIVVICPDGIDRYLSVLN